MDKFKIKIKYKKGPTKDTAEDFLRMIVEKDIKVVVMLTQIYEGEPPIVNLIQ